MELASREDFLKATENPQPIESLFVPFLKKHVWVQGLTAIGKGEFEESLVRIKKGNRQVDSGRVVNARARLAVKCLVNNPEERKRLFSDADAEVLGNLPASVLAPIYDLCQKLSGSSDEEIDELEKLSAEAAGSAQVTS